MIDFPSFLLGIGSALFVSKNRVGTDDEPTDESENCCDDLSFVQAAYSSYRATAESTLAGLQTRIAELESEITDLPPIATAFSADPSLLYDGSVDDHLERVNGVISLKGFNPAPAAVDLYEYIRSGGVAGGPIFDNFSGAPTTKTRLAGPVDPIQPSRAVPLDMMSLYAFEVVGLDVSVECPLLLVEFQDSIHLDALKAKGTFFGRFIWIRKNVLLATLPPGAPKARSLAIATGPESNSTFMHNSISRTLKGYNFQGGQVTIRSASVVTPVSYLPKVWISQNEGILNPPSLPVSGLNLNLAYKWEHPCVAFNGATLPGGVTPPVRILPFYWTVGGFDYAQYPFIIS